VSAICRPPTCAGMTARGRREAQPIFFRRRHQVRRPTARENQAREASTGDGRAWHAAGMIARARAASRLSNSRDVATMRVIESASVVEPATYKTASGVVHVLNIAALNPDI
jgi:hypothetical protein